MIQAGKNIHMFSSQFSSKLTLQGYQSVATMFINVHSEEMAKQWLKEHEHQTDVTYRITRGVPIKGQKVLYKTIRHCQHKKTAIKELIKASKFHQ